MKLDTNKIKDERIPEISNMHPLKTEELVLDTPLGNNIPDTSLDDPHSIPLGFLMRLFQKSSDGVILVNFGKIYWINSVIETLLGYSKESLYDQSVESILLAEESPYFLKRLRNTMDDRFVDKFFPTKAIHKNGMVVPIEIAMQSLQYGEKNMIILQLHPLALEANPTNYNHFYKSVLMNIFNSISEVVYISDIDTNEILFVNETTTKVFGNLIGKDCHLGLQGFTKPCPFCTNNRLKNRSDSSPLVWDFFNEKVNRWYRCIDNLIPWIDGRKVRFEIAIDITHQKEYEQKLTQLNHQFQIKNDELHESRNALEESFYRLSNINRDLELAKREVEHANRAKSEFLSTMSHELRTPLNGVLGHIQLLLMDSALTKHQKDSLEIALKSGNHLLSLIEDILEIATIESGKLAKKLSIISTSDMVNSILRSFQNQVKSKRLVIDMNIENLTIRTDKFRLKQIFKNLISNAVKYTPELGQISFGMQIKNDVILFWVKDSGMGIPEENRTSIFDPFYQVDSSLTREQGGTGLGLALCKRMIQALNGEIWVESEVGIGSTFFFTMEYLPVTIRESNTEMFPPEISESLKENNILIIEDDDISLSVLTHILNQTRAQFHYEKDGMTAYGLLEKDPHRFNIILMDLNLPNMDGFSLTAKIKNTQSLQNIPIIAVTAMAREEDRFRLVKAGGNDYLSKPYSLEELIAMIKKWGKKNPVAL